MKRTWFSYSVFLLLFWFGASQAEIYKYKDENGKWQFTDKKPGKEEKAEVLNYGKKKQDNAQRTASGASKQALPGADLSADLVKQYNPQTAIERTTLAVVSIQTPLGVGSGFFLSDDGYIVTNKHVVRPSAHSGLEKVAQTMEQNKRRYTSYQKKLDAESKRLSEMKKDLSNYKREIADYSGSKRKIAEEDYRDYEKQYRERKRNYDQARKTHRLNKQRFDREYSRFLIQKSSGNVARQFKVILKNEVQLTAELVALGKDVDLALLKLDDHKTPHLKLADVWAGQGTKVYAVGSPLGMQDFVTSGIVTRVEKDRIVTDTKILPGNSGGPLVDGDGQLIGVNTQVLSGGQLGSELFGFAIPIGKVKEEFQQYLPLQE